MATKLVLRVQLGSSSAGAEAQPNAALPLRARRRRGSRVIGLAVGIVVGGTGAALALRALTGPRSEEPAPVAVVAKPAPVPAPPAPVKVVAAVAPVPVETAPVAPAPVAAAPVAPAPVAAAPVAEAAPATAPSRAADEASCRKLIAAHRWRAAVSPCEAAATAARAAGDSAAGELALLAAQGQFARGFAQPALTWAKQALALDSSLVDAHAIAGRAEAQLGHTDAAHRAYRKYLQLAPRGWHARDFRAALAPSSGEAPGAASDAPSE